MNKQKRHLATGIAMVLLLAVVLGLSSGSWWVPHAPKALASDLKIKPTKVDSAGVDLDTQFHFSSSSPLDLESVKKGLGVEPAIDFTLKKQGQDKEIYLVPKEPLEPKTVYKFSMEIQDQPPLMWAFQTKGDFKVISTLPRDKTSSVPVDTGIEIGFSHLNFESLPDFLVIEPKVKGTFQYHKKVAVFLPETLMPSTIYTVTIKKGLPLAGSSETLQEDFVFQFETQELVPKSQPINFFKDIHEFTSSEKPLFQASYYGGSQDDLPQEGGFTLYRYRDSYQYIEALKDRHQVPYWAYYTRRNYRQDTSTLEEIGGFTLPTQRYEHLRFFEFPEPLPPGYYLVEANIGESDYQFCFQVTDLSLYATVAEKATLLWVNDVKGGTPVIGARATMEVSGEKVKTDSSGLASLSTPANIEAGLYITTSYQDHEAVAVLAPWGYGDEDWKKDIRFRESYWKYLYLDRSLYKPGDTLHFWGLIKPRDAKTPLGKITLELTTGGWGTGEALGVSPVTLDNFVFTDSVELPLLTPGYYNMNLLLDDRLLTSQSFEVQTYTKPLYKLEISPDSKVIFAEDTVNFKVQASFFEGTPAVNMSLNYFISERQGSATTNDLGETHITYTPTYRPGQNGRSPVQNKNLYVSSKLPEGGEIHGESQVLVLNNDIDATIKTKVKGNTATISGQWHKLTVDKVNKGKSDPWAPDAFWDDIAPQQQIFVQVYRELWEKIQVGQYYDFINKKVMPRFHYKYRKVLEHQDEFTSDEEGKGSFSFSTQEQTSYIVELTTMDSSGKPMVKDAWVSGPNFYLEREYSWYHLESSKVPEVYGVGEEVVLTLKNNESPLTSRPKGFLFYTARQGILDAQVQNTPEFTTSFQEDFLPNFWTRAVYFDGRYYWETPDKMVGFDTSEKALKLDISTDKTEYRPLDLVEVKVQVQDPAGKPVEAKVNLNLVDEALYALSDQHVDLLTNLYSDGVTSGIIGTLKTHEPAYNLDGGAEHGGEGGSERKDFRDAVLFETLTTDKNGFATTSFHVPDNLTSWRITGQAVTQDLSATTATSALVVKVPFFVDVVINERYLTGDKVKVQVRSFGENLKAATPVEYEASLRFKETKDTPEIEDYELTTRGKAFIPAYLPLPPLKAGEYELKLVGKTGDLEDSLIKNFTVLDTFMTQKQVDFYQLREGLEVRGAHDGITTLAFSNYESGQYLDILTRLRWAIGHRLDQKIGSVKAASLLEEYFPDYLLPFEDEDLDLLDYQRDDGGLSLLPYSDTDLELTAKAASLVGTSLDRGALAKYFQTVFEDLSESRERSILALYGLAALEEPVLQELQILSKVDDLTIREQIYITLALIEIGDHPRAEDLLDQVLQSAGENIGALKRIKSPGDQDHIIEVTALGAIAAAGLDYDEKNLLQAYVVENRPKDTLLYLDQLLFLQKTLPRLPGEEVGFKYQIQGRDHKVTLKAQDYHTISLTPEKLHSLKIASPSGKVGVLVSYSKPFEPPIVLGAHGVKIHRRYEVGDLVKSEFKATDLVKVHLTFEFGPTAPDGLYAITDYLPGGLKTVSRPYQRGLWNPSLSYPLEVEGQRVMFAIGKNTSSLHYYARVTSPGEYSIPPAVLTHMKSSKIYNISPEDRVIIP